MHVFSASSASPSPQAEQSSTLVTNWSPLPIRRGASRSWLRWSSPTLTKSQRSWTLPSGARMWSWTPGMQPCGRRRVIWAISLRTSCVRPLGPMSPSRTVGAFAPTRSSPPDGSRARMCWLGCPLNSHLEATFFLSDVPEYFTFNRDGIDANTFEYGWAIAVDIDNDSNTGGFIRYNDPDSDDGFYFIEGIDYELTAYHLVDDERSSFVGSIEENIEVYIWTSLDDGSDAFRKDKLGTPAVVDPTRSTLTIAGQINGIQPNSVFHFSTHDELVKGGEDYSESPINVENCDGPTQVPAPGESSPARRTPLGSASRTLCVFVVQNRVTSTHPTTHSTTPA